MTLMETMQTMDSGLTEREKDIRRYLLDHPEKVELFSARELGAATFTSAASVTRFCQKIGCKGYPDFKLRFLAELRQASSQTHTIEGKVLMTPRENAVSLLRKITEVQHRSVEQTRAELDLNQLIRVYQRLLDAQHLDFYAYDSSACIAEYACNQFYFAGKRAQIYRDTNMQGLNYAGLERLDPCHRPCSYPAQPHRAQRPAGGAGQAAAPQRHAGHRHHLQPAVPAGRRRIRSAGGGHAAGSDQRVLGAEFRILCQIPAGPAGQYGIQSGLCPQY